MSFREGSSIHQRTKNKNKNILIHRPGNCRHDKPCTSTRPCQGMIVCRCVMHLLHCAIKAASVPKLRHDSNLDAMTLVLCSGDRAAD